MEQSDNYLFFHVTFFFVVLAKWVLLGSVDYSDAYSCVWENENIPLFVVA